MDWQQVDNNEKAGLEWLALIKSEFATMEGVTVKDRMRGFSVHWPDGFNLGVSIGYPYKQATVSVWDWPSYTDTNGTEQKCYPYERFSIGIGIGRDAKAVVKDIQKRFIPTASKIYTEYLEKAREHGSYCRKIELRLTQVAESFGITAHLREWARNGFNPSVPLIDRPLMSVKGRVEIGATSEAVQLKLDVPLCLALRIGALVRDYKP